MLLGSRVVPFFSSKQQVSSRDWGSTGRTDDLFSVCVATWQLATPGTVVVGPLDHKSQHRSKDRKDRLPVLNKLMADCCGIFRGEGCEHSCMQFIPSVQDDSLCQCGHRNIRHKPVGEFATRARAPVVRFSCHCFLSLPSFHPPPNSAPQSYFLFGCHSTHLPIRRSHSTSIASPTSDAYGTLSACRPSR